MTTTPRTQPGPAAPQRPVLLQWGGTPAIADRDPAKDWTMVLAALAWADGHGRCGGYHHDPASGRITCACGEMLYEFGPVPGNTP